MTEMYPPCQNRNCKSYGKPHPNCRCYGYAEGGEVENACSSNRAHERGCEYYAEGGDVKEAPKHEDHEAAVNAYLSHGGLHGLIDMGSKNYGIEKYNQTVKRGHKRLSATIDHVFANKPYDEMDSSKAKETINDWVEKGGITQDIANEQYKQNGKPFAEGGHVHHEHPPLHDDQIAGAYPEHNVLLQAAKGRMANYLGSLKPQKNSPRLAFDDAPDDREKQKSYDRAVHIAADPMRVLSKAKKGTLEAEHVKHFQNLYPELNQAVQKKLTEQIIHAQLSGEKPNYHVRQGLSLLMGAPLSGELSPQNIMAAQSTFQAKKEAAKQGGSDSKAVSKLDQRFLTADQASTERKQKQ